MSSGSRTSPGLKWNNTEKPNENTGRVTDAAGKVLDPVRCPGMDDEPRGRDALFAGLCACGGATAYWNEEGLPRHQAAGGTIRATPATPRPGPR